jgi:hypothetical protein
LHAQAEAEEDAAAYWEPARQVISLLEPELHGPPFSEDR